MKRAAVVIVVALSLVAAEAFAGSVKTYQVTGPVLEVKDTMIVVQKGKDSGRSQRTRTPKSKVISRSAPRSPSSTR